jgi:SPP1 family predicted phage head-tail adaptor
MDIGLMNVKITIQKNTVVTDAVGNHRNTWQDFYTCHATVSGENGSSNGGEDEAAGMTVVHSNMDFTVRWCNAVKDITTDGYRVLFGNDVYNIIGIDHMNYKRRSMKLRCRKEQR